MDSRLDLGFLALRLDEGVEVLSAGMFVSYEPRLWRVRVVWRTCLWQRGSLGLPPFGVRELIDPWPLVYGGDSDC